MPVRLGFFRLISPAFPHIEAGFRSEYRRRSIMELPCRDCGDELIRSGEMTGLRQRMRNIASRHDLSSVIACAFDHRSRMLPFNYLNTTMAPAGVRAIGS